VSVGVTHDDVRSEPGSWMVVGMIPLLRKKVAMRAGRGENGPDGCPARKTRLLHQCYAKLLEGWNALTADVKVLQWADGLWRRSWIVLAGLLSDQPEADTFCCDGSQSCKVCTCPKSRLHEPVEFPLKSAERVRRQVYRAADGMMMIPGQAKAAKLFERDRRSDVKWKPTRHCTKAGYERARKALRGTHLMENAFWGKTGFDVQLQVMSSTKLLTSYLYISVHICIYICYITSYLCISVHICLYICCIGVYQSIYVHILDFCCPLQSFKDPMHAYDHGVAMQIITASVKTLHNLEDDLGLARNTLVKKLTARVHNLCSDLSVKHTTMMSFANQSIMDLFEKLTTPDKKGQKQCPIVDATDVQKLMLNMPYLLDGLAQDELAAFNAGKAPAERVADPMPEVIKVVNEWLHWYHLFRQPVHDEAELARLTSMGRALLPSLERVFPFRVRVNATTTTRSMWCTEKVHSILHAPRLIRQCGRSKNVSCQVTEARHKGVKAKGTKTNRDPATHGLSVMKAEVRDSAARMMALEVDLKGASE